MGKEPNRNPSNSGDHEDPTQDLGAIGNRLRSVRASLRVGGPEVDHSELYAFVDGDLAPAKMREVGAKIGMWQAWHDAYWEIRSLLGKSLEKDSDTDRSQDRGHEQAAGQEGEPQ